jgi:hypothetical protein
MATMMTMTPTTTTTTTTGERRRWRQRQSCRRRPGGAGGGGAAATATSSSASSSLLLVFLCTILLLVLASSSSDRPVVVAASAATTRDDVVAGVWQEYHDDDKSTKNHPRRPTQDYCGNADPIHRDISSANFPNAAWQMDAPFVQHLLHQGEQLVSRAQEAILTEYGHGPGGAPPLQFHKDGTVPLDRRHMFAWQKLNDESSDEFLQQTDSPTGFERGSGRRGTGGWTTTRSWHGLVRRLLHAIITNDEFVIVLAGHSAAAGHGNHVQQAYIHQLHRVLVRLFVVCCLLLYIGNCNEAFCRLVRGGCLLFVDGLKFFLFALPKPAP